MNKPKIVRNISGFILVLNCMILIALFGIMPLVKYSACPILKDKGDSIYEKNSLAFVREVEPGKLDKGDIAVYYSGDTPIGAEVLRNDRVNSELLLSGSGSTKSLTYRKISGKGTSFSVPLMGSYANWLINGIGVNVTVIIMGVMFVIFAVSAIIMRDNN